MAKVLLTPEAKADIARAAAWYREKSTLVAGQFLLAVGGSVCPHRGATDLTSGDRCRDRRPAGVAAQISTPGAYLIDGGRPVVFAVIHHRRDDPAWRGRLE